MTTLAAGENTANGDPLDRKLKWKTTRKLKWYTARPNGKRQVPTAGENTANGDPHSQATK
jgi:hypothetical protein